jgi:hypothetical protein
MDNDYDMIVEIFPWFAEAFRDVENPPPAPSTPPRQVPMRPRPSEATILYDSDDEDTVQSQYRSPNRVWIV